MADKQEKTPVTARARQLAEPVAAELSLLLWDVQFVKEGATWFLRFTADKPGGVTMDDLTGFSHRIDPLLDETDFIDRAYCLEVSSPGLARKLTRDEHFAHYIGQEVVVKLFAPLNGERRITGTLTAYQTGAITVTPPQGEPLTFEAGSFHTVTANDDH